MLLDLASESHIKLHIFFILEKMSLKMTDSQLICENGRQNNPSKRGTF